MARQVLDRRRSSTWRWLAAALAVLVAASGVGLSAAPGPASAAEGEPIEVSSAKLTWAYSRYAQYGVFGQWRQWTDGTGVTVNMAEGESVSGDPADAGRTFLQGQFDGGTGTIDPETGEGTIAWDTGEWVINAYPAALGAPDETYADPILTIGPDGSGTLSMDVFIPEHVDFLHGGGVVEAVGPERKVVATFDSVDDLVASGFGITPDFAGREYVADEGLGQWSACDGVGGSWPADLVDFVPPSVRPHYYTTSCSGLNLMKPPLPFEITWAEEAPAVTQQPTAPDTIAASGDLGLATWVTGTPTPTVRWQRSFDDGATWTDVDGGVGPRYPFSARPDDDGARFRAVATNVAGSVTSGPTSAVAVTTEATAIVAQPASRTVGRGDQVTFAVGVTGAPTPTVTWERSDDDGATWVPAEGIEAVSGTSYSILLEHAADADDGARFRAVATNGYGDPATKVSDEASLTVRFEVPEIVEHPVDLTTFVGQDVQFEADAESLPAPSFQWEHSADGETWSDWVVDSTSVVKAGTYHDVTIEAPDTSLDRRWFRLRASNDAGTVHSEPAQLTVVPVSGEPEVLAWPTTGIDISADTQLRFIGAGFAPAESTLRVVVTDADSWQPGQPGTIGGNVALASYSASTLTNLGGLISGTFELEAGVLDPAKSYGVATFSTSGDDRSWDTWTPLEVADLAAAITAQPADATVGRGEAASFTVGATGFPMPTYQWQRRDDGGETWADVEGATEATFEVAAAAQDDDGARFRVIVANGVGDAVTSEPATLSVVYELPVVVGQPQDRTGFVGQGVAFSAEVDAKPAATYRWERSDDDGATWAALDAATATEVVVTPASAAEGGALVRLVATNEVGATTSDPAQLHVLEPSGEREVVVVPGDPLDPREEHALQVVGAGFGPEDVGGNIRLVITDSTNWQPGQNGTTAGSVAATMLSRAALDDAGGFFSTDLVVPADVLDPERSYGVATFSQVGLFREWDSWTPLAVTTPPEPLVVEGAQLRWTYNQYAQYGVFGPWSQVVSGPNVSPTGGDGEAISGDPADAGRLFLGAAFDGGTGTVEADTGAGTISWDTGDWVLNAYSGQFGAPDETIRDPELTIEPDGSGTLTVEAYIPAALDMAGNETPAVGPERVTIATFDAIDERTDTTLHVQPDFVGRPYTPTGATEPVSDPCDGTGGSWPKEWIEFVPASVQPHYYTTSCSGLNLKKPPLPFDVTLVPEPVAITTQPTVPTSLDAGTEHPVFVEVTGNPTPTFQWQRSDDDGTTWADIDGATAFRYPLVPALEDDGAQLRVVVGGGDEPLTSDAVTLDVVTEAPAITTQPSDVTFAAGEGVTIYATATGKPVPTFQWQRSDDGGDTWTDLPEPGNPSYLQFDAALADDGAQFRLVADNGVGEPAVSAVATLTVTEPGAMVFTTQPADQTVGLGDPATFHSEIDSDPAPSYRWQRSDDDGTTWTGVEGGTGRDLTIPTTSEADDGARFRVIGTNGVAEPVTSEVVTLSVVVEAPTFTVQPTDRRVFDGGRATFSATAQARPAGTWQWQSSTDGGATWVDVEGATSMFVSLPTVGMADDGTLYRAVVTNMAGTATSEPAELLVLPTDGSRQLLLNPSWVADPAGSTALSVAGAGFQPSEGWGDGIWVVLVPTSAWQAGDVDAYESGAVVWTSVSASSLASGDGHFTASLLLDGLDPEESYHVITYSQDFSDRSWDSGAAVPFEAPEEPGPDLEPAWGTGTWGIRTSYRNYINGPIAHGTTTVDGGVTWLEGDGNARGPFTWPVVEGAFDPETETGEVRFAGSVYTGGHDYGQGNILELELSDLRLDLDGEVGTLTADLEYRPFVGANPSVPPPPVETADDVAFATVDLSGATWPEGPTGQLVVDDAPAVGVASTMELIGWDAFYGGEMPDVGLDPLSLAFQAGEEPEPVAPSVVADPVDVTVVEGGDASFSASFEGDPVPEVGWQRLVDGEWVDVDGVAGETLTLAGVSLADSGAQVRAVATNVAGSATSAVATLTVEPDGEPGTDFPDVPEDHAFFEDISWLVAESIATGYEDGTFKPMEQVSRQAMAAFVHRLAGSPEVPAGAPTFSDVPVGHPFFEAVSWLAAEGITTGYEDGTFRPGEPVSREATAAFMHRLAGSPEVPVGAPSFSDVPVGHPFAEAISWLAANGVTTGYEDGTFRGGEEISRQAMAAFLHRFADLDG